MFENVFIIGRFQPFHIGHLKLIEEAKKYGKRVIVLIGSANLAPSIKNPFSFEERSEIIKSVVDVETAPCYDYPYDDRVWVSMLKDTIASFSGSSCIVGANKDESSYYLKILGDMTVINAPVHGCFDATSVRKSLFESGFIPPEYSSGAKADALIMKHFLNKAFLKEEYLYIKRYKDSWKNSPFPPTFNTADNFVIHRDKFLAINRRDNPGKGFKALPGGFVNVNEPIKASALRELREETSLRITNPTTGKRLPIQEEWMKNSGVFDHPTRSQRGRVITHAFGMVIPDKYNVSVEAGDDAASLQWESLSLLQDIRNAKYFMEDHFFIMLSLIGGMK